MIKLQLAIAFIFICGYCQSQDYSIQTLEKQFTKAMGDSEKTEIYVKESSLHLRTNRSAAKAFAAKAFQLSKKSNSYYLKAKSLLAVANAERFSNDINILLKHETDAIYFAKETNNTFLLFDCLNGYANDLVSIFRLSDASKIIDEAGYLDAVANNDYKAKLLCTKAVYQFKLQKSMSDMKALLNESLQLANKESDPYLAAKDKLQLFTAMLYSGLRDSTAKYVFEALEFFETNNYREQKAYCLLEIAKGFMFQANFDKSNAYCDSAYTIMLNCHNELGAANVKTIQFQNYSSQKKFDDALKAAGLIKYHNTIINNPAGLCVANILLASSSSAKGNYSIADSLFKQSEDACEKLNIPVLKTTLLMHKTMHLEREKKYAAADSIALKGYEAAQKSTPKELIKNLYTSDRKNVVLSKSQSLDKRLFQDSNFRKKYGKQALLSLREKQDSSSPNIFNPILSSVDKSLTETYNKQLLDVETKYKTREKDDRLRIQKQNTLLATSTIKKQNLLVVSIAITALLLTLGLILQVTYKRRALRDKAKIELFQNEIHHRVKNNLGSIKRFATIADQSGTQSLSLASLQNRITAIELLHKNLYQSTIRGEIFLQNYIEQLTGFISDAFKDNDKHIRIIINAPVTVHMQMAEKLGLIINELVTNSFKYGFNTRREGEIEITGAQTSNRKIILVYKENGTGYDLQKTQKGYGTKLIEGVANELKAAVEMKTDNGIYYKLSV